MCVCVCVDTSGEDRLAVGEGEGERCEEKDLSSRYPMTTKLEGSSQC